MDASRLLSRAFLEAHPANAAAILERLPPGETAALLAETPADLAAPVVGHMAPLAATDCLAAMTVGAAAAILARLAPDAAAGLLRRVATELRESFFQALPGEMANFLRLLLRYPEGTAGALMDPRALAVPQGIPVGEALARVRRAARHVLYYVYVVDDRQTLVGVVNLRELMLAPRQVNVAAIMRQYVSRLSARADRAAILAHPGWQRFHALPVVDGADVFLGIIRYETLRQLEGAPRRESQGRGALDAVLTIGELCWSGLALVLADLASGVVRSPEPKTPSQEATHDPESEPRA